MDFKNNLYVLQVIETVQGEGDLIGVPSLLIRLAGCNCRCPWCDTPWSWTDKKAKVIKHSDFTMWWEKLLLKYSHIPNLMITGGEPLLYENNPLFKRMISETKFRSIEIETNGSLLDSNFISNLIPTVKLNISPKLDSNWYIAEYGVNQTNIKSIIKNLEEHKNYIFKFVNDPDYSQITEDFIINNNINLDSIYMMALTPTRNKYDKRIFDTMVKKASLETIRLCIDEGYNYTTRLHLYLWDDEQETIN